MIDLKSDFMNRPTEEMWEAMRRAELGWAVGRQDETVRRLEQRGAELMGKEAALFVPTGRMACLVALMTLCGRGNQVVLEQDCHIAWAQEWGLAYICGLYPRLVGGRAGVMDPGQVEEAIIGSRFGHAPKTDLVCLENTHNVSGGRVMTARQTAALAEVAHRHGAKVFLDGCRIFYAAAALEVGPAELAGPAEAVVFSLVKGLCGPGGVLLCGSSQVVGQAWLNLQRLGGHAFHRAAILAAGDLVALETMAGRLKEDIARAKRFAGELAGVPGVRVEPEAVESNIVLADVSGSGLAGGEFLSRLESQGVLANQVTPGLIRFTFHRHIGDEEVGRTVEAVRQALAPQAA